MWEGLCLFLTFFGVCEQIFSCDFKINTECFGSSWSDWNLLSPFFPPLCMSLIFSWFSFFLTVIWYFVMIAGKYLECYIISWKNILFCFSFNLTVFSRERFQDSVKLLITDILWPRIDSFLPQRLIHQKYIRPLFFFFY